MTEPLDTIPSPTTLAGLLLTIIANDMDRFDRIDRYVDGDHDKPYMPVGADEEYRQLADRSVSNWMPLLLDTPAQALYVDGFRRGVDPDDDGDDHILGPIHNQDPGEPSAMALNHDVTLGLATAGVPPMGDPGLDDYGFGSIPEWNHWQLSRLDSRQIAIHRGALKYGHSFTVTELGPRGKAVTRGLSGKLTAAVFEDPANDLDPYAALTVTRMPTATNGKLGLARMWDATHAYTVTFTALTDTASIRVSQPVPHGASECPVTRFAAQVDLEGRTTGVIERFIPMADRIDQTVFDLLVAQTYGSFQIRTVTGMAPPMQRYLEDDPANGISKGDPVLDGQGNPIPQNVNLNARRFFFSEDPDVKFGTLPPSSLAGYIESLDMSIRQLAAMTQTPPHYLLGQIANLSAEALQAAESTLLRKVEEYRKSFGESWERVFRIAGELNGQRDMSVDYAGEVIWRDTEMRSLAATSDALVKLKLVGVPEVGLWPLIPGTTRTQIEEWLRLRQQQIAALQQMQPQLAAAAMAARAGASEAVQVRENVATDNGTSLHAPKPTTAIPSQFQRS